MSNIGYLIILLVTFLYSSKLLFLLCSFLHMFYQLICWLAYDHLTWNSSFYGSQIRQKHSFYSLRNFMNEQCMVIKDYFTAFNLPIPLSIMPIAKQSLFNHDVNPSFWLLYCCLVSVYALNLIFLWIDLHFIKRVLT